MLLTSFLAFDAHIRQGSKNPVFFKKAQPSGFFGVLLGF